VPVVCVSQKSSILCYTGHPASIMNASKTNQPSPPPPPPLEEKIQSALTTLRRDREKDYRTMLEAQERERHAKDELVALETMVEELTKQKTLLIQENETVKTQLPSLESHVNDLAEQVGVLLF